MRSFILPLVALTIIAIAAPAQSEELKLGSVEGHVMTALGKPISDAKIVLSVFSFQTQTWSRFSTETNVKGWYVFKDVPVGKVDMQVYHYNRGPAGRTFELLSDVRQIQDFIL